MTLQPTIAPDDRLCALYEKIEAQEVVRIIEAHNGLSGLVGEHAAITQDDETIEFDGFWESSLTDTAAKGMPDAEIVGYDSRADTIDEILNVTTKPMIVDGDTGGTPAQFEYFVKRLERMGVSAVIIEDKTPPKRNSLDASADQTLEDPHRFAQKIQRGLDIKLHDEFLIIARIESLIAGVGREDALHRAETYVKAGVDGIMIHSKDNDPSNILAFADKYDKLCDDLNRRPPLVSVPTTYNLKTDTTLSSHGFDVIIHANHLLRASHQAMNKVAETILLNDRSFEADPLCTPVAEIFEEVGFGFIKEQDRKYSIKPKVVIPAAGQDSDFDTPKAMLNIAGQTLLNHQLQVLQQAGLSNVTVVRGFRANDFDSTVKVDYLTNEDYAETGSLESILLAMEDIDGAIITVFSDILFEPNIIERLKKTTDDIVIVIDNSYRYHKNELDKELDLVMTKKKPSQDYRSLHWTEMFEVAGIGKQLSKETADHEFIGIAKLSQRGIEALQAVYEDCDECIEGRFHEVGSFRKAGLTDMLQELINRGYTVKAMEIHKGWHEVHDQEDLETAQELIMDATITQ